MEQAGPSSSSSSSTQQQQQHTPSDRGAPAAADAAAPLRPVAASAAEANAASGSGNSGGASGSGSGGAGSSSGSEREAYLEQKYGAKEQHVSLSQREVEGMLDDVLARSAPVKYLLESLRLGGCAVGRNFFHVTACDKQVGGGFSPDYGVILCHNRLEHRREVELAVAHELVHAYDFCRAADLDLTDCRHHACTEIRAANLSGDCTLAQEFLRGNATADTLVGKHKRCVRRRALFSVALNPHCQGAKAEQAVAEMMPKCLRDTDPWPRVPGL